MINNSLDEGTQLPYIRKALNVGYGVVVLNTNDNKAVEVIQIPIYASILIKYCGCILVQKLAFFNKDICIPNCQPSSFATSLVLVTNNPYIPTI